ncbi:4'-phosphopantetheinyl transferase superfamily [Mrakia frigida]|uniref:holo-ACP synthase n=1 Tax=Mrakia frigida TaxID=29902 RepID=UPI003FCC03BF
MAILGYGIDLLHLPRITSLIARRGLAPLSRRILSSSELDLLPSIQSPCSSTSESEIARFMAVRWAAKESIYKALQPHFSPSWKDVSILPLSSTCNKPTVVFEGKLKGEGLKAHLSISHDGDYLVAGVLVEKD